MNNRQPDDVLKMAKISTCGRYRYTLHRRWDVTKSRAVFIMLNPSTADAEQDDPTIRRCTDFARTWGLGGIVVLNLYAYRATKPTDLWRTVDPVGPDNDRHLLNYLTGDDLIIAAWGVNAEPVRVSALRIMLHGLGSRRSAVHCLGMTKAGAPRHPLYVRGDTEPQLWWSP
jgi:hypothetical protein